MKCSLSDRSAAHRPAGFTLVEMLVVITIIVLVSAVTLPAVLPALNRRAVSEASRVLQAALVGARDQAILDNAPRGIRLLPDPVFNGIDPTTGKFSNGFPLAYNRFIPLQSAGDYTTGKVTIYLNPSSVFPNPSRYFEGNPDPNTSVPKNPPPFHPAALRADECPFDPNTGIPNERTSWFWNIRIGDKIRFSNSGRAYTIVGPAVINPNNPNTPNQNPELYVNDGPPGSNSQYNGGSGITNPLTNVTYFPEYLYVVNGQDDDNDGFVDNGWDRFDNDYNTVFDEYSEWGNPNTNPKGETDQWVGTEFTQLATSKLTPPQLPNLGYTINRRPTPIPGSRITTLPGGVLIDGTTGVAGLPFGTMERSRLPIDPRTLYVDILVNTNGQVLPTTEYSRPTASSLLPFYHFWLTERQDVHATSDLGPNAGSYWFLLPLPQTAYVNFTPAPTVALQGDRGLITLFTRTGQITNNSIENFDMTTTGANGGVNAPFYPAQSGVTETQ
jgi:prepilin-type N-terminal cleavage/methylation domain-containing protein